MRYAAVVVVAALWGSAPAHAGVRISVDPTAPFTERDLAQAVELRWTTPPDEDVDVRIARLGFDQLIVIVGNRTETVALPDRDRSASARVVAVIVTSLVESAGPP